MLLENIVIGSSIEAAVYAFVKDYYLIPSQAPPPIFYEKVDFNFLGNSRKDYCWSRVIQMLALSGKLLSCEERPSIKIQENIIKIIEDFRVQQHSFEKCYIFDSTGVEVENEIKEAKPNTFIVYDDFELSSLGEKYKYIEPGTFQDNFAKKITYYTSSRVDGAQFVTDCVVESLLSEEEINNFDYSDTMARFVVERHLSALGVKGTFMNFYKNGTSKYRKPKVVHKKRLVYKKENTNYRNSDNVIFLNISLEEIFNNEACAER